MGYLDEQELRLELCHIFTRTDEIGIGIIVVLFDSHCHLSPWTWFHKQIGTLQSLSLITYHVDLGLYLSWIFIILPQNDSDEIRDVVARLMLYFEILLEFGSHSHLGACHYHIIVSLSEDPSHSL